MPQNLAAALCGCRQNRSAAPSPVSSAAPRGRISCMRVSVLGLGRMGREMAGRLLRQGHEVTVWNRSPGKIDELVRQGALEADGPRSAAASAEVVITMLANDDAVRSVALGSEGVIAGLAQKAVYVDSSTVSPKLVSELAEVAGAERFVAMPVLGAPSAVAQGRAVYLVGGAEPARARIEPLLSSLTDSVRHYDRAPLAAAAKLASNLLLLSGIVALAEAFTVGRSGGLDDDQLRELFGDSPLVALGLKNRFEGVLSGKGESWWTTTLGAKDAALAVGVASDRGVALPAASVVSDRYRTAAGAGHADDDIVAVADLYRS
jgi:3-hydroxyisobutyrate dehydrogenase-like beta-hydroxyacid dehydrogenase